MKSGKDRIFFVVSRAESIAVTCLRQGGREKLGMLV